MNDWGILMRVRLARRPVCAIVVVRDPNARRLPLVASSPFWRVFELGAAHVAPPCLNKTLMNGSHKVSVSE